MAAFFSCRRALGLLRCIGDASIVLNQCKPFSTAGLGNTTGGARLTGFAPGLNFTHAGALLLSGAPWAAAQDSIYEAISGNPNLSSLQRGIDTLGFSEALADPSLPYTLLAPGNEVRRLAVLASARSLDPGRMRTFILDR